jgi:tetratricopeptide (TPR) repeat protein
VLWITGESAQAESEFRATLAIYQRLADEDSAWEFRRGLGASHFYLSGALWDQGKPEEAETELRSAVALQEGAVKAYPAVTRYHRSLAIARCYLGRLSVARGKPEVAEAEYNAAITILKDLIADNAGVAEFRSIMAFARTWYGIMLLQAGKPRDAENECRSAVDILQALANDSRLPANRYVDDHTWALTILGDVSRSFGRSGEAKDSYQRAVALAEPPVRKSSKNPSHRLVLAAALRRRGLAHRDLGELTPAAADFRRALQLCGDLPLWHECLIETAGCHAALASLAGRTGSGVSAVEGQTEADHAMERLGRAVAKGYRNVNAIRIESAFDSLRNREDFKKLMKELQATAPKTPEVAPPPPEKK